MNKLWVRLQHQGHSREREKRTQERKELQLLVGSNIVRLSQLVDLDTYKNIILAPLLEQVVQCRDVLAQEYLLEVITQVFPDEFHLHTLDQFLAATARLNPAVNIKAIVIGMMDRLSSYATKDAAATSPEERLRREEEAAQKLLERLSISKEQGEASKEEGEQTDAPSSPTGATTAESVADSQATTAVDSEATEPAPAEGTEGAETTAEKKSEEEVKGIPESIKLYEIFFDQVLNLIAAQNLPIQDIMALLVSLSKLALNIYPDQLQYIDQILE
jgi:vacuolar protein sorting-associated protein 35